ncbi:hypothetical protein ACFQ8T_04780, partial [Isoptericola sp. NPDC056618]
MSGHHEEHGAEHGAEDGSTTVPAAGFGPPEDGLQRLWTPHRMVYIGGQDKPADGTVAQCPFCRIPAGGGGGGRRGGPRGGGVAGGQQEPQQNRPPKGGAGPA